MKTAASLFLLVAVFSTGAQTPPLRATHIGHADIQSFLDALPKDAVSDKPIRIVEVGGYHVGVYGVLRPKTIAQEANLHQTKVTEIYYILQGNATLVTGGHVTGSKAIEAGFHDSSKQPHRWRGKPESLGRRRSHYSRAHAPLVQQSGWGLALSDLPPRPGKYARPEVIRP